MTVFFFTAKTALVFLPTAHFVVLRPPFPIRPAQFVQVFPLKPAPFCKLSAGLGSTKRSAIPLRLSLCPCHFVFFFVFPFTANSLAQLAETVFSILRHYEATIGPWTFIFSWERHGWLVGQTGSPTLALRNSL